MGARGVWKGAQQLLRAVWVLFVSTLASRMALAAAGLRGAR